MHLYWWGKNVSIRYRFFHKIWAKLFVSYILVFWRYFISTTKYCPLLPQPKHLQRGLILLITVFEIFQFLKDMVNITDFYFLADLGWKKKGTFVNTVDQICQLECNLDNILKRRGKRVFFDFVWQEGKKRKIFIKYCL